MSLPPQFGLQDYSVAKFRKESELFANYHLKMAAMEELSHPVVEFLTSIVIAIVIYFGGTQVLTGKMSNPPETRSKPPPPPPLPKAQGPRPAKVEDEDEGGLAPNLAGAAA